MKIFARVYSNLSGTNDKRFNIVRCFTRALSILSGITIVDSNTLVAGSIVNYASSISCLMAIESTVETVVVADESTSHILQLRHLGSNQFDASVLT
jgi:hypothetical protein